MQNNDSLEKQVEEIAAEITNGQFKRALDFIGGDEVVDGVRHHLLWNHLGSLIEGDEEAIPAVYEFTREQFARYASANSLDEPTMDLLDTLAVMTGFYVSREATGLNEALDACFFFEHACDVQGIASQKYRKYPINKLKQALWSRGVLLHPSEKSTVKVDSIGFTGVYERTLAPSGKSDLKVRIPAEWSGLLCDGKAHASMDHGLIEVSVESESLGEGAPSVVFKNGYCFIPNSLATAASIKAKGKAVLAGWGYHSFAIGTPERFRAWEQETLMPIIP